jgi:hypothetical protein
MTRIGFAAIVAAAASVVSLSSSLAHAGVPTPDHVVIVIEENESANAILGNASAPYLNSLATSGQSLTNFFAISHPSQPNYLQMFSGSNQNVFDDNVPSGIPYSTPNLGASLITAGRTFGGYSETLPSVGYNGASSTTVVGENQYVRKHNPWANWQDATTPTPTNRLSPSVNMPFSGYFPSTTGASTDFATLPTVAFVVPNEQNDMHDGTIAQADTWLQSNIEPYRAWAAAHNSLLIITWDEDNHTQNNQIPTIMVGPMVRNGVASAAGNQWNLHNLLRTVSDMYGAAPSGSAARVAPITGIWANETAPLSATKSFRQNVNSYTGAKDTWIDQDNPSTTHGTSTTASTDGQGPTAGGKLQGLIRFDNIIGNGADQVPANAQVLRATLTITTGSTASNASGNTMMIYRMLSDWTESSTWTSMSGGVTVGSETLAVSDTGVTPETAGQTVTFDVTQTLQEWANGALNRGWLLDPTQTDGWVWNTGDSATASLRPILNVSFAVPEPGALATLLVLPAMLLRRRRSR